MTEITDLWNTIHSPLLPRPRANPSDPYVPLLSSQLPDYKTIFEPNATTLINIHNEEEDGDTTVVVHSIRDLTLLLTSSFECVSHQASSPMVTHHDETTSGTTMETEGVWNIRHVRPFISWSPQPTDTMLMIPVPYRVKIATTPSPAVGGGGVPTRKIQYLAIRTPFVSRLRQHGNMPEKLLPVLKNPEAIKMFCSLRGIGVKPEVITYTALLGVAKRTATWGQALAIH
eukprot:PhF_6_TR31133/c4_g1_i2/m.45589